jgi:hypothetical protein
MQSRHCFRKLIDCINVVIINGNYNKKTITKALANSSIASIAFFHTSSSYQAYLLFYKINQEILHLSGLPSPMPFPLLAIHWIVQLLQPCPTPIS